MRAKTLTRIISVVRYGLIGAGALALAGFLFVWSGVYSIAASKGHFKIVEWALTFGMRSSVRTHAVGIEVPPLDDANLTTLGAAHFHSGCAYCHGAPGVPRSPIALAMLPPPPDLSTDMRPWRDRERFWIVKHGIKYTGMPGWASQQRDDEVWAVIAFLKKLPSMHAADYRDMAVGELWIPPQSGRQIATTEATSNAASACARCHGADRRGTNSDLVPLLHGQPVEFLNAALEDYASGRRASGIMQPVANELEPGSIKQVAAYYAGLTPPIQSARQLDPASIERGRALAKEGDAPAKIPACSSCHRNEALKAYPRLAGQNAAYMANRLRLWKNGFTAASDTDTIMAPIAKALNDGQIDDVAVYFSSLNARPGQ
jgi:cytochrome c553